MLRPSPATLRKIKLYDRLARWVVTLGGAIVIVSVLGRLVLILGTTLTLFFPARARLVGHADLPPELRAGGVLALGIHAPADDKWVVADLVDASGVFRFIDITSGDDLGQADAAAAVVSDKKAPRPKLLGAAPSGQGLYSLRWSTGAVTLVKIIARAELAGKPLPRPKMTLETLATIAADKSGVPEQAVMYRMGEDSSRCATVYDGKKIVITTLSTDVTGDNETKTVISEDIPSPITSLAMASDGKMLYAGTSGGSILWWRLDDQGVVADRDVVPPASDKQAITSLQLMLGDITLVAGDASGAVTNWFFTTPDAGLSHAATLETSSPEAAKPGKLKKEIKKLTYIRALVPHDAAIRELVPSPRNRGLLVRDENGTATMDYTTNQRRLVSLGNVSNVAFGPRGDMLAGIEGEQIKAWRLEGDFLGWRSTIYPEVNWSGLWGRVWYEGMNSPEFSWQPEQSADAEPKFSLVPMLFGTLKGTFYAMLLAVPLALGGAAYVSHFTSPRVRAWIKPTIEMMAAVPSVVLGFLVGLWLAPLLNEWLAAFFLALVSVPVVFVVFLLFWQAVRKAPAAEKMVRGREFLVTFLLISVGLAAAALLSHPIEQRFCGGDLVRWLSTHLGLIYVQRNSILIAFGVGFMVIPMIFTLAEDALSSVPHSMTAASLALGASRWQTLRRVILPSASPGIFAAVMIGFGRAVGETMVFLMATGNSAQMDWSPFNGMRTLSANIAQEKPGAPLDGTLYRILFLCAVILFVMTFFLNTCAEFVRQRLRRRYGQF